MKNNFVVVWAVILFLGWRPLTASSFLQSWGFPQRCRSSPFSPPSSLRAKRKPMKKDRLVFFPSRADIKSSDQSELDPDRERRRQLIFSMLAAVSASVAPNAAASAASNILNPNVGITANEALTQQLMDVVKAPLDDREYKALTLVSNSLRVLLCSDDSTNEAAVAMDVHVGATSDPETVPGLAHFTEHMLFLGTKPYPKENSFEAFLANNGGSSNAFTDSEDTVYYFDMEAGNSNKLAEGLKRFGSFFTSPLFTSSATGRELNAIESENKKNLQSDTFRSFQISKARANSNHPFSKFFTGNRKTLLDDTQAQGIDLREELVQFYKSYYSANQMTLAVIGPQPIEELEKMVQEAFGQIPNTNGAKPEAKWAGVPPFSVDNSVIPSFGYVVEIVPVQDLRQLAISWPIVYRSDEEREDALLYKTSNYVAHLLGHEGPRSLLSYLKSKGWANGIASASQEELSDFELFEVVIGLTTQGLAAVNEVVAAVYSYINMIRDGKIPDYVFNEVLELEELQWRFLTKGSPRNYAQSLATSMQKYPPVYYVAGPRRLALDGYKDGFLVDYIPRIEFTSKDQLDRTVAEVDKLVSQLTVENSFLSVVSKSFENQTDRKEKWYGTDYRVRRVSPQIVEAWKNPASQRKLKIDFPKPNPFIPTEMGLQVKFPPVEKTKNNNRNNFEARMKPAKAPRVIREDGPDGQWTVYFKEDETFGLPKGYIVFRVLSLEVFSSSKKAALANLLEVCVTDRLGEYAYDAGLAGLIYEIKVLPRGLRLTFGGYSDKLKSFAAYVAGKLSKDIRNLLPRTDQDFDRYKDQVMRALSAFDYTNKELRDETRSIILPDLLSYADTLWSAGKGEALIQGNFDEPEALVIVKSIGDALGFRPVPSSEVPPPLEPLPLPRSNSDIVPTRLLIAEPNPSNENSASVLMLQSLSKSETDHVLIELIAAIVEEPFYDELRTKRQLGYIVSSGVRGVGGTRTLSFIVQSNVAPSAVLSVEIINFLETVAQKLEKVSMGDLAVYVKSLIDRKTEPDKDLSIEVTRNWSEIASGRLQFDRRQREAAALLQVEKEDLIAMWNKLYAGNGRRVLITEIIPRTGEASSVPPPATTGYLAGDSERSGLVLGIDDIAQFRRDREKFLPPAS